MSVRSARLAGPDAAWLHVDRPRNRMIVNTVLWTARPVPWDRVLARFGQVVARFPGLRSRVDDPPVTLGLLSGPRWEPVALDIDAHVRRTRLPAPGDDAALRAYVAAEAAADLDHGRPLWQLHAIDGYGAGSALLLRTHHALADGTGLMRVVELLTDPVEDRRAEEAGPASAPGPRPFSPKTWTDGEVLSKLVTGLPPRAAALAAELSGTKSVWWSPTTDLGSLRRAGREAGATVNDVVLAAVAGALGEYLADAGTDLDGTAVDAVIPVSLRPPGEVTELGNRFGLVFAPLPVDERDAGVRLIRTKATMDRIKATSEAQMSADAFDVLGHTPRGSARRWVDSFARRASVVVTNIRGPAAPVGLGGQPLEGLVLLVPSTGPVGVGLSICSYAGGVRLGLISDDAVVADPTGLGGHLAAALVTAGSRTARGAGAAGTRVGGQAGDDLRDTGP